MMPDDRRPHFDPTEEQGQDMRDLGAELAVQALKRSPNLTMAVGAMAAGMLYLVTGASAPNEHYSVRSLFHDLLDNMKRQFDASKGIN